MKEAFYVIGLAVTITATIAAFMFLVAYMVQLAVTSRRQYVFREVKHHLAELERYLTPEFGETAFLLHKMVETFDRGYWFDPGTLREELRKYRLLRRTNKH